MARAGCSFLRRGFHGHCLIIGWKWLGMSNGHEGPVRTVGLRGPGCSKNSEQWFGLRKISSLLRDAINRGLFPVVRHGRRLLVWELDLLEYLDSRRTVTGKATPGLREPVLAPSSPVDKRSRRPDPREATAAAGDPSDPWGLRAALAGVPDGPGTQHQREHSK